MGLNGSRPDQFINRSNKPLEPEITSVTCRTDWTDGSDLNFKILKIRRLFENYKHVSKFPFFIRNYTRSFFYHVRFVEDVFLFSKELGKIELNALIRYTRSYKMKYLKAPRRCNSAKSFSWSESK